MILKLRHNLQVLVVRIKAFRESTPNVDFAFSTEASSERSSLVRSHLPEPSFW